MRFLFNTTKRTKNLIVILPDLNATKMPLSQHGGHTQITIFSLATEAGQEEQRQSRTSLQVVAALIEKGSHLQKPLRLLPPWEQAVEQ
jgi:hypothetical protein